MNVDTTAQTLESQKMGTIADDMERALDTVFKPLGVRAEAFEGDYNYIDYTPPFYLEDKCNQVGFGVKVDGDWSYPLKCKSDWYRGEFVVANADDWINHLDKFVAWHDECVDLINRIRSIQ